MSKTKIIYIISDTDHALAIEWVAAHLADSFGLSFILIGKKDPALAVFLEKLKIKFTIVADERYPTYWKKFLKVFQILKAENPEIIHSHLWRANLIAQPAAWLLRIRKRVFTRHHALIHYTEFPSGRKFDRIINFMATDIVAISNNVYEILYKMDRADKKKITLIPHGFNLAYFENVDSPRVEAQRARYNLPMKNAPVIGVISRYLEWKGIQFIIPAFSQVRKSFPNAHLVLANSNGNFKNQIKKLLVGLPEGSFTEIGFESDIAALYKVFDVFVHVPIDPNCEAFGQTYVEALAAGVPSVFTLSGIASEFIVDRNNALVVDFKNSIAIEAALKEILDNTELRNHLIQNGRKSVQSFSLDQMVIKLEALYG